MKICPTCNQLYHRELLICPKDGTPLDFLREWRSGDFVSGRFRIVEKIGHGSMGSVFKAEVLKSGETRALKVLAAQLCDDEFMVEDFRRKLQAASTLRHPNVVQMESLERSDNGRPFIVMEYVPGLSLRDLTRQGGPLPVSDIVDVAAQICSALECAHRLEFVHRDIRPENIYLTEAHDRPPVVKVAEFGMARLREAAAERGKQIGGVIVMDGSPVVGTLEYMSPEQARGAPENMLGGRSDLYSLGVLMFEALTGVLPISAENPERLLLRHIEMSSREPMFHVVMRALHPDPNERYQSASEMALALRAIAISLSDETALREMQPETKAQPRAAALLSQASRRPVAKVPEMPASAPEWLAESSSSVGGDQRVPVARSPRGAAADARTDQVLDEIRRSWARSGSQIPGGPARRSSARFALLAAVLVSVALGLGSWLVYRKSDVPSPPPADAVHHPSPETPQEAPPPGPVFAPGADEASPLEARPTATPQGDEPAKPQPPNLEPRPKARTSGREGPAVLRGESGGSAAVVDTARRVPAETKPRARAPQLSAAQQAEFKDKLLIGRFLMERKDYHAAAGIFEEALKIDPSSLEAKAALRLARSAAENPDIDPSPSDRSTPGGSDVKR